LLEPHVSFSDLGDRLEKTVDYAQVCEVVKELAASRARNLIETLAEDIAAELLRKFPLCKVEVVARKYVLSETESVGVKIRR
jgi:dihydroneopterin aldolase